MRVAAASKAASASCVHRWMDLAVQSKTAAKIDGGRSSDGWKSHKWTAASVLFCPVRFVCESGDLIEMRIMVL